MKKNGVLTTTHNVRTCPCGACREIQGRHEAFIRGLNRGLELAKEHATAHQANAAGELEINWAAAEEAVRKESL